MTEKHILWRRRGIIYPGPTGNRPFLRFSVEGHGVFALYAYGNKATNKAEKRQMIKGRHVWVQIVEEEDDKA